MVKHSTYHNIQKWLHDGFILIRVPVVRTKQVHADIPSVHTLLEYHVEANFLRYDRREGEVLE